MFGIFKKKRQPASAMDALRDAAYEKGAKTVANLPEAIKLADEVLLRGAFQKQALSRRATELNNGPLPYSTHDLAAAVTLAALRSVPVAERPRLMEIQMMARMTVGSWLTDGKIAPLLAKAFEETLYKDYDPSLLGGESVLNQRRAEPASPTPKALGNRNMPQLAFADHLRSVATKGNWRDLFSRSKRDSRNLLRLIFEGLDEVSELAPQARANELTAAVGAFVLAGYLENATDASRRTRAATIVRRLFAHWTSLAVGPIKTATGQRSEDDISRDLKAYETYLYYRTKTYGEALTNVLASHRPDAPPFLISTKLAPELLKIMFREINPDPKLEVTAIAAATVLFGLYAKASGIGR